jgi:hypothetical protein
VSQAATQSRLPLAGQTQADGIDGVPVPEPFGAVLDYEAEASCSWLDGRAAAEGGMLLEQRDQVV